MSLDIRRSCRPPHEIREALHDLKELLHFINFPSTRNHGLPEESAINQLLWESVHKICSHTDIWILEHEIRY